MIERDYVRTSWENLRNTDTGYLSQLGQEFQAQQSESGCWQLELQRLTLDRSRFSEHECERSQMTFASPIKLLLRQIILAENGDVDDIHEQELYAGETALDTSSGIVLVDGEHRIIRSELGPCMGLAPFERGWCYGNLWGDCLEFTPVAQGVQVRLRLAEDSLSSAWTTQTVARIEKGRKKFTVAEPELRPVILRDDREAALSAAQFCATARLPQDNTAIVAPQTLFERAAGQAWSEADFIRVVAWVRSEQGRDLANSTVAPLRVLGPGLVLARWLRRGLFLSWQHAIGAGDQCSFGTSTRQKRRAEFDWMPCDVWHPKPLSLLLRARLRSDEHTPRCDLVRPIETAELTRSVRVPSHIVAPPSWGIIPEKKGTMAELPFCEQRSDGTILRPDRITVRSIAKALALGGSVPARAPMILARSHAAPVQSELTPVIARLGGTVRTFAKDTRVLVVTEDAIAVEMDGIAQWIERRASRGQDDSLWQETLVASAGITASETVYARTSQAAENTLALGVTVRVGFDARVSDGSIWVSRNSIGDALCARAGREVSAELRDTRYGAQAWTGGDSGEALASVGERISRGGRLASVDVPVPDISLSPEDKLLKAIFGERTEVLEQRVVSWTGPDATIVERTIHSRRGTAETAALFIDRERKTLRLDRRARACEEVEEPFRTALLDAIADERERTLRGDELAPGVLCAVRWLLAWDKPLAIGSILATLTGEQWVVEQMNNQPLLDNSRVVDALLPLSCKERLMDQARATGILHARGDRVSVALSVPWGESWSEAVRSVGLTLDEQAPFAQEFALYLLRLL